MMIDGVRVTYNEHRHPDDEDADDLKLVPNGGQYSVKWSRYFHELSDAAHEQIKKEAQDASWEAEKAAKRESMYKNLTPEEAEIARKRDEAAAAAEQRNMSPSYVLDELKTMMDFVKEVFPEHINGCVEDEGMSDASSNGSNDEDPDQQERRKRTIYVHKSQNWDSVKDQKRRGQEMKDVRAQSKWQYIFGKRFGRK